MKSVLVHRTGGPEVLNLVDLPIPTLAPHDVQIRAEVFGVGQPDVLIRSGVYKWMPPMPANPGNEAAGYVTAVGKDVRDIVPGTKVLISSRELSTRGGCYSEYIVVPATAVFALPDAVDLHDAVCLGNYQVAWALLHACGSPQPARSALVIGAAGGVGSALVQLSKLVGMSVFGTVSTEEKARFAKSNGVDQTIFYRSEDVVSRVMELTGGRGVGQVFDHVAGAAFTSYLKLLDRWGTLISYNAFAPLPEENLMAEMRNHLHVSPAVRCFSFHVYDDNREERRAIMHQVISALERREIRPAIAKRFRLSEVREAHRFLESGGALGKIIMTPD